MPSLGTLKSRILNELKRPSLTAEVALAVADAIDWYATTRFWFNEVVADPITTESGTASYPLPATFRKLIRAEITIEGQRNDLCPFGWDEYRDLTASGTNLGQPTDVCLFGGALYPYPIPNGAWPITLTMCSALGPLDGDAAANAWTTEAEPLIRARAKWDLLTNVIRDYDEAGFAQAVERDWLARLLSRGSGYGKPSRIAASGW